MTSSQGHRAAVLARRPRFPPEVVARAVALHRSGGLTLRETHAAMIARGVDVSVESLRAWVRTTPVAASPAASPPATWTWRRPWRS